MSWSDIAAGIALALAASTVIVQWLQVRRMPEKPYEPRLADRLENIEQDIVGLKAKDAMLEGKLTTYINESNACFNRINLSLARIETDLNWVKVQLGWRDEQRGISKEKEE
jgi:hypothetical protein